MINKNNLIWIDLEMTGLNPEENRIIEIATIVTDYNLSILSEGPVIAIYQPIEQLLIMDKWNQTTHTKSGLISRVISSKFNEKKAEVATIKFLEKLVPMGVSPICGSTVAQDRRFLFKYMPKLEKYFHYRYLDVSSLKELAKRWQPKILKKFVKKNTHKAIEDIRESISELIFYRKYLFKI